MCLGAQGVAKYFASIITPLIIPLVTPLAAAKGNNRDAEPIWCRRKVSVDF
jgi:hypothetical protein